MEDDPTPHVPVGSHPYPTVNVYNHVVIGHDGKIYKGTQGSKLPTIAKSKSKRTNAAAAVAATTFLPQQKKQEVSPTGSADF